MPIRIITRRCQHCGHEFKPRVELPPRCNNCKRRWPLGKPKGK